METLFYLLMTQIFFVDGSTPEKAYYKANALLKLVATYMRHNKLHIYYYYYYYYMRHNKLHIYYYYYY